MRWVGIHSTHQVERCTFKGNGMNIKELYVCLCLKCYDSVTASPNCLRISNINCHKLNVTVPCQCDSSDKGGQNV